MTADRDAVSARHDDAPVTTSKDAHPDRALVAESVTINRPPEELYAFWRQSANLVAVMDNIASIKPIDDTRSRWTVKAPAGREVSWESVITKDVPGKEITWQSAPGADVANSGRIEFQDAGARGTIVRAVIAYDPPGGTIASSLPSCSSASRACRRGSRWNSLAMNWPIVPPGGS